MFVMKKHPFNSSVFSKRTRIIIFLYNLFFPVFFIILLPKYLPRMWRRGGYKESFLQRLGIIHSSVAQRLGEGRLWVHAASVGETFLALKFIRFFHNHDPQVRFLLSVTTTTGLAIAKQESSEWLEIIASPLDFFLITNSFLDRFKPLALIMVEGDLWVQRLWYCKQKGILTGIISARLSPRSERRFQRFRVIIAPIYNLLDFIGFPSKHEQERWNRLGIHAQDASITGNIKFDQVTHRNHLLPDDYHTIFSQLKWSPSDPIFLAGSTANLLEEEEILKAWLRLRLEFPLLRLIIVPRHVERRHELIQLFGKKSLSLALRSSDSIPPAEALLLDTTGELQSWYSLANVVFIGKSLGMNAARGGQNLVEPLLLGAPVLVGPFMENFQPLTSDLINIQGVISVSNEEEIVAAVKYLLLHPEEASRMVERACQLLKSDQGATERTCSALLKLLPL